MYPRRFVAGAALPPSWDLGAVLDFGRQGGASVFDYTDVNVNLAENLLAPGDWAIRDQGARGTCNAFAVVAAEELVRYRRDPRDPVMPLSEEQFYASIRKIPPACVGINLTAKQLAKQSDTGTTYLAQAAKALVDFGICRADLLPYQNKDFDIGFATETVPDTAMTDAAARRLLPGQLTHNIIDIKVGSPPKDTVWVDPIDSSVSDIFIQKLLDGLPVVASFAILSGGGQASWHGPEARWWGKVRYPRGSKLETLQSVAGHTVCIVGFVADVTSQTDGWFLLRNSVGRSKFAYQYRHDPHKPRAPASGYGYVSVDDVNTYCWEYLMRSNAQDAMPIA